MPSLSWIRPTYTPHGQEILPKISRVTLVVGLALPLSALAAGQSHNPYVFFMNSVLLLVFAAGDVHAHQQLHLGMHMGRRELVAEVIVAHRDERLDPHEYLLREVWWDGEMVSSAQRTVRRSTRGRGWSRR